MSEAPIRCLWLAREMPYPLVSGDRVYTAGLSAALANSGVEITFLAHEGGAGRERGPDTCNVQWEGIRGGTKSYYWVAATKALPVTAAIHDTWVARRRLAAILKSTGPDLNAILFDQLGSGWALNQVRRWIAKRRAMDRRFKAPKLLYLAHNHERRVWADMTREASANRLRKFGISNNARKVARLESALIQSVDQVVNITVEDALALLADGAPPSPAIITPGYADQPTPVRLISAKTPRRAVMVGSFRWAIKQENLRQFLAVADPAFARHGIRFDVIGMVPEELRRSLEPGLRATTLHGYVADTLPLFSRARIAVVPEVIGGGFKLKFLDYLFGRLPVATIDTAVAGLPVGVKNNVISAPDLDGLVKAIIARIDDIDELNRMQHEALASALTEYDWADRGDLLKAAIENR